ncbi:hypothetical protein [uncultured Kocuria sp.]|uniref:hypothetical protein n=1 Tax=uncultured Kocuria sp. TaxID=259305 RepID=UPI0025922BD6|nr:hypothetical protein [uncultured Kocuria sp.]MCT1368408.1 hypothetical protein [Rothia sp. p3-SID1597]
MFVICESSTLTAEPAGAHRYRARLIAGDIWGGSGYYPAAVLERDGPRVWPIGTQVFLDHPGQFESYDLPERSIRDLAGKIVTTPVYENDGIYAEVEFYPHIAPIIEAMWADVGMSIRASADAKPGEADGRSGPIIQRITSGISVDVVTKAGAGGKLVALLESARNNQGENSMDPRTQIEATLTPDQALVDYDDAQFVYRDWKDKKFYRVEYTLDGDRLTPKGEPTEVKAEDLFKAPADPSQKTDKTPYVNVQAPAHESARAECMARQVAESLQDKNGNREVIEAVNSLAEQNRELADAIAASESRARRAEASQIVAEAFAGVEAPKGRARLIESAVNRQDFNPDTFKAEAIEAAAEYTPATGTVRGLGGTTNNAQESASQTSDIDRIRELRGLTK